MVPLNAKAGELQGLTFVQLTIWQIAANIKTFKAHQHLFA
jgi:hypothetical protein